MTGRTHIFVGAASTLVITAPDNIANYATALIGGALGGIISDIDLHDNRSKKDGLYARMIVLGLIAAALLTDKFSDIGIITHIKSTFDKKAIIGIGLFILLSIFGILQEHRKFTHSLLAAAAFSCTVGMIYPPLCIPFAVGFVSHIAIDILNKKPLQLFWPLKAGVSLNLCYSNKLANNLFFAAGLVVTAYFAGKPVLAEHSERILEFFGL